MTGHEAAAEQREKSACEHVWRIARPRYRGYDGWGYGYWIIDWYCEKCRKIEKRVVS